MGKHHDFADFFGRCQLKEFPSTRDLYHSDRARTRLIIFDEVRQELTKGRHRRKNEKMPRP
jgi:hypothetical protein